MGEVDLNSDIWDGAKRTETIELFLTRLAKRFKSKEVQLMEQEIHTGRLYKRTGSAGFQRFHQASDRGQRPARDTGNLIDSVEDEKSAPLVHDVFVNEATAPYGKYLQDDTVLDRPIFKDTDLEEFHGNEMQEELDRVKNELIGGI
jgi:hypothetical protein